MFLEENPKRPFAVDYRSAQVLQDQIMRDRECERLKRQVMKLQAETEFLKDSREWYRSGSSKKTFKTWR